jgi:hypothetical protein
MRFLDSSVQDYAGVKFDVYKDSKGISYIKFSNGNWLRNEDEYAKVLLGKCNACLPFFKDSFKGFEYDKVLIAGLGLGLISNELSQVNKCSKIDVVEISQEVIDYTISSGHLPNDINIIKSDIFEYTTIEKYDLIIIDTIWEDEDMSEAQVDLLTSKFLNTNLNEGGVLYTPVKYKWLVNK